MNGIDANSTAANKCRSRFDRVLMTFPLDEFARSRALALPAARSNASRR